MAEIPDLIKGIFPGSDGELSKNGIYQLQVFIRGVPTIVHIDDIIPVTKYGRMIFSECNPKTNNCWGPILEKLWSKINVNYERTCAGW